MPGILRFARWYSSFANERMGKTVCFRQPWQQCWLDASKKLLQTSTKWRMSKLDFTQNGVRDIRFEPTLPAKIQEDDCVGTILRSILGKSKTPDTRLDVDVDLLHEGLLYEDSRRSTINNYQSLSLWSAGLRPFLKPPKPMLFGLYSPMIVTSPLAGILSSRPMSQ